MSAAAPRKCCASSMDCKPTSYAPATGRSAVAPCSATARAGCGVVSLLAARRTSSVLSRGSLRDALHPARSLRFPRRPLIETPIKPRITYGHVAIDQGSYPRLRQGSAAQLRRGAQPLELDAGAGERRGAGCCLCGEVGAADCGLA